jgi:uncharacterized DUF497 family protein
MGSISFEWDPAKDLLNQKKHGVSFAEAQRAFLDKRRVLAADLKHSTAKEARHYCFGKHGGGILTVRFTYRGDVIRIFGAGYWTKGKQIYEQTNQVHEGPRRRHPDR